MDATAPLLVATARKSLRDGFGGGNVPGIEQDERISSLVKTVKRLGVLLLCLGVHRTHSWSENPEDVGAFS
ncbi:MAG TPA: hypothetical protein VKR55_15070 [Bradyrhizobium sp.]|uniref:hypothetical protein n=1 Tax=Bradyrhizobium sp. TaxID=376 RepID=UPI002CBEB941|nr:hypothetical protein [Bradyrhizobium sp.]HLZ03456.1 hypothetical protein [Bradyrhizobium sp.]